MDWRLIVLGVGVVLFAYSFFGVNAHFSSSVDSIPMFCGSGTVFDFVSHKCIASSLHSNIYNLIE